MLDLTSKTWPADRAAAEKRFVEGTISAEDLETLRNSISTENWINILRRQWLVQNDALLKEVGQSDDLTSKMLIALANKP